MMHFLKIIYVYIIFAITTGCTSISVQDYKNEKPEFNLFQFFEGPVTADGFFENRSGKIIKRIHVVMKGRIEGNTLIVDEDFSYSDGTTSKRTWKFTKSENGLLTATAEDVTKVEKIEQAGFSFNMKYQLQLPYDNSTMKVDMNDWMFQVSEKQIINKTEMTKFGLSLGKVTLIINKKL